MDPPVPDDMVLACRDLDRTVELFTTRLGFRLDVIMPADAPDVAVLSGHGVRLTLARDLDRVTDVPAADQPLAVPPNVDTLELTRPEPGAGGVGRAAMRYRDLLPSRRGGRFIASHITIADGGPVPDYVHHHRIRFQVIHCLRGWVRVVYEGQGPPFVLEAGDSVLQPPGIRHRVLESSAGVEVLEVTCPAEHPTFVEHDLTLPTAVGRADRSFDGQRFVRHRARAEGSRPWRGSAFTADDTGIGAATDGLAGVRTVRPTAADAATPWGHHDAELVLWYVARGSATLELDGHPATSLGVDDTVAVPAGLDHALTTCSPDLELVEVSLPDRPVIH